MNVSLTKKLEKYVRDRVKSGDYGNASEVIRDALRRVQDEDLWTKELRAKVREAEEDFKAGRYENYGPGEFEKFKKDVVRAGRARARARRSGRGAA